MHSNSLPENLHSKQLLGQETYFKVKGSNAPSIR